jgi:hypothetical protein
LFAAGIADAVLSGRGVAESVSADEPGNGSDAGAEGQPASSSAPAATHA